MDTHGRVAVVTGGGSGLGRHLVLGLVDAGCRVLVADRDEAAAEGTVALAPDAAEPWAVDVRDDAALAGLVARAAELGGPHVVVNNAGGWSPGEQFPQAPPAVWSATLDRDLRAPMLLTQLALPAMRAVGGGAVVGIGSSGGVGFAGYGSPEYAAAKAGMVRFTASLSGLEETHGVRVMAVVPDWIGLDRAVAEVAALDDERRAELAPLVPPDDVVAVVLDLVRSGPGGAVVEMWGGEPPRRVPPRRRAGPS
jgi:3-oxoacyl-[acyl-carrier protein] reductase